MDLVQVYLFISEQDERQVWLRGQHAVQAGFSQRKARGVGRVQDEHQHSSLFCIHRPVVPEPFLTADYT